MRIALLTGHSILANGKSSGANGYFDEYVYILRLLPILKQQLIASGYECDVIACPEKIFKSPTEEIMYKIPRVNIKDETGRYLYDLVLELHLNGSVHKITNSGTNVYYKTGDNYGYVVGKRICSSLNKLGFINGGVHTPPLYIINESVPTCIAIELFYCTSIKDIIVADRKGMDAIASAIVDGINNTTRVNIDDHNIRHGWEHNSDGSKSYYKQNQKFINIVTNIHGKYYIFDTEGKLSYGWKQINNCIYYFDKDDNGAMVIDTVKTINGKSYKFNEDGILINKISNVVQVENDIAVSDGTLIIYPNDMIMAHILQLYEKYPTAYFIRESDYPDYKVKYTRILRAEDVI
jgi:N-acetylmuramoyl-L-alanine amidase (cell wall hydrolase) (partial) region relative to most database matches|nr:MAG TPA: Cell wall hydrolase autolysin [Caudoviricetes sp.]